MSGRKDWEVEDLLEEGVQARNRTENILNKSIGKNEKLIEKADSVLAEAQSTAERVPELNDEAAAMFGADGKAMVANGQAAAKKLKSLKECGSKLGALKAELASLDRELKDCDRKADEIRRIISHKSGYLDREYEEAAALKTRYKRIATRRSNIASEINKLASVAQANASEARALLHQVDKIAASVADMNKTAKNKADADALKEKLNQLMDDVDSKWAEKFLSSEYHELQMKIKALSGKSDEAVIKDGTVILGKANAFVAKLTELTEAYEKAKEDAENLRDQAEALTGAGYVDPVDFMEKGDKAKQIALFTYLKKYKDLPYEADFDKLMDAAEAAEDEDTTESFIRAQKLYEQAYAKAEEARSFALALQEHMIKGEQMTAAIYSVMYYDMKYAVHDEVINGNPADGYRIICSSGGEKITFEVKYDKDGNPKVELDHEEDLSGTCRNSWAAIVPKMRGKGFPLFDVKKDGKTILGAREEVPGPGKRDQNQQRQRK